MKSKLILIFLLLFSFLFSAMSQNINKDSVRINISRGQLDTLNIICLDRIYLKKELDIKNKILINDSILIGDLNLKSNKLSNIIKEQQKQIQLQNNFLKLKQDEWSRNYKKSKRKGIIYGGIGGTIVGLILGIIITK